MQTCSNCGAEISESYRYCPMCAGALRCAQCGQSLISGAAYCFLCGSAVCSGNGEQSLRAGSQQKNEIEFSATPSKRMLRVSATDKGLASIVVALAPAFGGPVNRVIALDHPHSSSKMPELPPVDAMNESGSTDGSVHEATGRILETLDGDGKEKSNLARLFAVSEGTLRSTDSRFKAKNQRDFVIRATCLFMYANQKLLDRQTVPRKALNEFLERFKVYDSNARAWLNRNNEISIESDGSLVLTVPGEELARESLADIQDSLQEDLWTPGQRKNKIRRAKASSSPDAAEASAVEDRSKSRFNVGEAARACKKLMPTLDMHQLLPDATVEELGTFALWTMEQASGQSEISVSCTTLEKYCLEAFSIKKYSRSFENALRKNSTIKKWVVNTNGTTYKLTPNGRKWAAEKGAANVPSVFAAAA